MISHQLRMCWRYGSSLKRNSAAWRRCGGGLMPHRLKDLKIAYKTIYAHAETADTATSYRQRALHISSMPPRYLDLARSRNKSASGVLAYWPLFRSNIPSDTSASKKSRALRGCRSRRVRSDSLSCSALASSVNTPSSMALRKVFEPQKPKPSCMILSGVTSCDINFVCGRLLDLNKATQSEAFPGYHAP